MAFVLNATSHLGRNWMFPELSDHSKKVFHPYLTLSNVSFSCFFTYQRTTLGIMELTVRSFPLF